MWSAEQHKKLLDPMPESLTASPDFHLETGSVPVMEFEKDIKLGRYSRHPGECKGSIDVLIGLKYTSYSCIPVLCGVEGE